MRAEHVVPRAAAIVGVIGLRILRDRACNRLRIIHPHLAQPQEHRVPAAEVLIQPDLPAVHVVRTLARIKIIVVHNPIDRGEVRFLEVGLSELHHLLADQPGRNNVTGDARWLRAKARTGSRVDRLRCHGNILRIGEGGGA